MSNFHSQYNIEIRQINKSSISVLVVAMVIKQRILVSARIISVHYFFDQSCETILNPILKLQCFSRNGQHICTSGRGAH